MLTERIDVSKMRGLQVKLMTGRESVKKIIENEMSQVHLIECMTNSVLKNKNDVKSTMEGNVRKWRDIIKIILDDIITMSTCNLAFRGHRNENVSHVDRSSVIVFNIIDFLSKYDPLLSSHLQNSQRKVYVPSYTK